jgi:hypothetical protein
VVSINLVNLATHRGFRRVVGSYRSLLVLHFGQLEFG